MNLIRAILDDRTLTLGLVVVVFLVVLVAIDLGQRLLWRKSTVAAPNDFHSDNW